MSLQRVELSLARRESRELNQKPGGGGAGTKKPRTVGAARSATPSLKLRGWLGLSLGVRQVGARRSAELCWMHGA